ncbi:ATP synthase F1 subunit delta [Phocicoccus pinnipedialis]|uniref:ATP synthase subunit delta n=1 Tax=Phocicoccus pinnipedialis TaxID=110845 RepID=A0A6V7R3Z3_9BACL|nr:ATP synthase F1 subunit delta [Jeotgalicoccus pinnipedialis]MBP1939935.1 F-type H+-transporting ATPase subunit delta [Jeotgalicoccus pinnipedialis]CAD2072117.1 ATP synthase subunit delta [Jeotgalicoccus pinnipedialis]
MTEAARQYADALFQVVKKHDKLEDTLTEFNEVLQAVESVENFDDFMTNPRISKNTRLEAVKSAFKDVNPYLRNLILILTEKSRTVLLPSIKDEFELLYDEFNNQARVTVESIYELSTEELDKLGKIFIAKTGYEKLLITNKINKSLIGGFRVLIGSKVYDESILSQLNVIRNRFKRIKNN